ncbi:MAG: efflux RND transporter permease subunit [Bacteroidales bacterium]
MRKIIEAFVRFPFYAKLFIFVAIVGGILSHFNMKMSFFPERSTTEITVSVIYLGASPKEMEEGITARIEEAVRGIVGIKEMNSYSSENQARVKITTTGEYDIDQTLAEVKNAVDGISSFPLGAERPIVFKQRAVSQVGFVGLKGNVDRLTLKKISTKIEEDLLSSGVITQFTVLGFPSLEISVDADEKTLLRHGLTLNDIINAIKANNNDVSGGMIRNDLEEVIIRSRGRTTNPDEIGNIVVRGHNNGSLLRIYDVADVKFRFAETSAKSYSNGRLNATFAINKLATEDLSAISAYINNYIDEFNASHSDVKMTFNYDFLTTLKARLDMLVENGVLGLVLVLVVLGFFLSIRLSFWVAAGIPISFLGMMIVAQAYGITINMISLFGMILVIGILVDDGIVIGENIYSKIEKGMHPRKAAVEGTMEMVPAVFTSVLTTCIAFSPLLFATGQFEFMFEMAFVVIVSLLISLIEAFFVLPAHLSSPKLSKRFSEKEKCKPNVFRRFADSLRHFADRVVRFMSDRIYAHVLKVLISLRWAVIFVPVLLIFLTVGLFRTGLIKATFFPSIPFDFFTLNMAFTPGSGEKQTEEYLWRFSDTIQKINAELNAEYNSKPGYTDTASFIQNILVEPGSAFDGEEVGSHSGHIMVLLKNMEGSGITSFDVVERIRKRIGPVPEIEKFNIGARNTFGNPISVALLGRDLDELQQAKKLFMNRLYEIESLKDVRDNSPLGKREVLIEPNKTAYFLGLNRAEIARQVRNGFFGGQAQRLQVGRDEVRVYVRYPRDGRLNISQLEDLRIRTPKGEYPLRELADFKIERGPVTITRYNGRREVLINADLVNSLDPVPPILTRIKKDIVPELKANYPGIHVKFMGQAKESEESSKGVMVYFFVAFALIVLILMLHFRSVLHGLLILSMIPLGLLGAIWGHGIEGVPVSMLSAWGMVALMGVIINDAVVFLSTYNGFIREGIDVKTAVFKTGISRFRPIVLTTLTTSVGLYPLILESSFQAKFLIPMAVSLAYGVFIGTAFILTIFPSLIIISNYWRRVVVYTGRSIRGLFSTEEEYKGNLWPTELEVEPAVKAKKLESEEL